MVVMCVISECNISGADIICNCIKRLIQLMGGPDGAVQAGTAELAYRARWTVAAVNVRGGSRERRRGGGGYFRRSVAGYSLRPCSLHPVAPGGGIHSGPDRRHQENA